MFKMIEVVGVSKESFSDAVRQAVLEVGKSGEDVHFLEVVEQRGSVRGGQLSEFQVKLKIGVKVS